MQYCFMRVFLLSLLVFYSCGVVSFGMQCGNNNNTENKNELQENNIMNNDIYKEHIAKFKQNNNSYKQENNPEENSEEKLKHTAKNTAEIHEHQSYSNENNINNNTQQLINDTDEIKLDEHAPLCRDMFLQSPIRHIILPLLISNFISCFGKYDNTFESRLGLYIYTSHLYWLLGFGVNYKTNLNFHNTNCEIKLHILGINVVNLALAFILAMYNNSYDGNNNIEKVKYHFLQALIPSLFHTSLQILEIEVYICDYYSIRINIGMSLLYLYYFYKLKKRLQDKPHN